MVHLASVIYYNVIIQSLFLYSESIQLEISLVMIIGVITLGNVKSAGGYVCQRAFVTVSQQAARTMQRTSASATDRCTSQ
jgi:hypothetical protein